MKIISFAMVVSLYLTITAAKIDARTEFWLCPPLLGHWKTAPEILNADELIATGTFESLGEAASPVNERYWTDYHHAKIKITEVIQGRLPAEVDASYSFSSYFEKAPETGKNYILFLRKDRKSGLQIDCLDDDDSEKKEWLFETLNPAAVERKKAAEELKNLTGLPGSRTKLENLIKPGEVLALAKFVDDGKPAAAKGSAIYHFAELEIDDGGQLGPDGKLPENADSSPLKNRQVTASFAVDPRLENKPQLGVPYFVLLEPIGKAANDYQIEKVLPNTDQNIALIRSAIKIDPSSEPPQLHRWPWPQNNFDRIVERRSSRRWYTDRYTIAKFTSLGRIVYQDKKWTCYDRVEIETADTPSVKVHSSYWAYHSPPPSKHDSSSDPTPVATPMVGTKYVMCILWFNPGSCRIQAVIPATDKNIEWMPWRLLQASTQDTSTLYLNGPCTVYAEEAGVVF